MNLWLYGFYWVRQLQPAALPSQPWRRQHISGNTHSTMYQISAFELCCAFHASALPGAL
jgi:hypothetical protein